MASNRTSVLFRQTPTPSMTDVSSRTGQTSASLTDVSADEPDAAQITAATAKAAADALKSDPVINSLAIVSHESFPRIGYMSAKKESAPSVYAMFEANVKSAVAKKRLLNLLTQRVTDEKELNDRLDFVTHFRTPEGNSVMQSDLEAELIRLLDKIPPLAFVLNRMQTGVIPLSDWKKLVSGLFVLVDALNLMAQMNQPEWMAQTARDLLTDGIKKMCGLIEDIVDLDTNKDPDTPISYSFRVKEGYNRNLDECYNLQRDIDNTLHDAALREMAEWTSRNLPAPNFNACFTYGPGFYLQFSLNQDLMVLQRVMQQRGAEALFAAETRTGTHLYYSTEDMKKLNVEIGDKIMKIPAYEHEYQMQVKDAVLEQEEQINRMLEHCANISALFAYVQVARKENWVRPQFSATQLEIRKGRHPIYETLVGTHAFKANDVKSPHRDRKIKIITGPNASGKTVLLKQTGLIVHLALCGSYVPAEHAIIPIVDQIFPILKHDYSITNQTSTFMSDLTRLIEIVKMSTSRSLVLVDEFGKGTRPQDGIALLAAAIDIMIERGPPHVMIASHIRCLPDVLKEQEQKIQYLRFAARLTSDGLFDPDYTVEEGICTESLASSVYRMVGLRQDVADRANEVYNLLIQRKKLQPKYTDAQKAQVAKIQQIAEIFRTTPNTRIGIEMMFEQIAKISPI